MTSSFDSCSLLTQQGGCLEQGGPIEYHKKSLRNLAAAVKQAKRLCAVILDTVGRELTIRRPHDLDEQVMKL